MSNTPGAIRISKHADARCRQRGLTSGAIALVMEFGEVVDDGYVMSLKVLGPARKALQAQKRVRESQQLDHLRNITVIDMDNTLVTVYRADKTRLRRLRRGHILTQSEKQRRTLGCELL